MEPQSIKLFNTKSRSLETFIPIKEGHVGIYSCGPTVYHYAHLGNLRGYIVTDLVRRTFNYAGYEVNSIINITDVGHNVDDDENAEDKMEKGSKREGKSAWDIAKYYTNFYFKDLETLNIPLDKYIFPRATDTIPEQIEIVKELENKGYTYKTSDGIYFDTSKFLQYPDLAKLDIKGLQSGARVEDKGEKKNITDFALWKFSPKDEKRQMEWESPWGIGFPGWHIECSAMSRKYLGKHFDIHMGGIDHIPVHHTNEIAQSECANGEKYVNYWLHYNFLNDPEGKMAKSRGDFLRLQSVIDQKISPLAFKYYILTVHYRSEISFSFESLRSSSYAYEKLLEFIKENEDETGEIDSNYLKIMKDYLYDDLSTPSIIATIWKMIKDDSIQPKDKVATILEIDKVLGLDLENQSEKIELNNNIDIPTKIIELLNKRKVARSSKDFETSDKIRNQILELGYEIKDNGDEQVVTKSN